jgi:elongation factor P
MSWIRTQSPTLSSRRENGKIEPMLGARKIRASVGACEMERTSRKSGPGRAERRAAPFSPQFFFANVSILILTSGAAQPAAQRWEVFVASIEYSQVRKGMVIVGDDGQLYHVVDRDLNTPGNWRAILQLKLKNLKTGSIAINRVRPQDKVEQAYLDKREMQYIYQDGDGYVFMDTENFDQITLDREWVGDLMLYMKEGNKAQVVFYEAKPISLELPATVELTVTDTEPALKGATAAAQFKEATLETGLKIKVPPFVAIGEAVSVDTRSGEYLSRAK